MFTHYDTGIVLTKIIESNIYKPGIFVCVGNTFFKYLRT